MERRGFLKKLGLLGIAAPLVKVADLDVKNDAVSESMEVPDIKLNEFKNGDVMDAESLNENFRGLKEAIQNPDRFRVHDTTFYGLSSNTLPVSNIGLTSCSTYFSPMHRELLLSATATGGTCGGGFFG